MNKEFRGKYYEICCEYFRDFIVSLKIPAWCKYCYACGAKIEKEERSNTGMTIKEEAYHKGFYEGSLINQKKGKLEDQV